MPREAAIKARATMRAAIDERDLEGLEAEFGGRKRAAPKRFGADDRDDRDFKPK